MILKHIQSMLEKNEFMCSLLPSNEQALFDRLLIFLGLDLKKRERMLELIAIEQPISPEYALPDAAPLPFRIQFRTELPFKIDDIALNQVASLLLFLNQFIDLPGFELDELNGKVIYRYVWIIYPTLVDTPLMMSIMGAIILNLSLFSETIESLADGKTSFNDLLAQIVELTDQAKKNK